MYTIEENNNNSEFDNQYNENNSWSYNKGIVIKIVIIILCIIVLVWLFKALKTKNNTVSDESTHIANVEKVRLAAEEYFFLKNNKSDVNSTNVSLMTLKANNLSSDIVDANNKVCSDKSSIVTLTPQSNAYKMTIKLDCSTNDKEEVYLYNNKTLVCSDCNGKTLMSSEKVIANENVDNEESKTDATVVVVSTNEPEYSCITWSDWTTTRVNNPYLIERSKTLVQGVKYAGSKTVYGEWSEYSTTPIVGDTNIEVETKVVNENVWSEPKTATYIDSNKANIKVINTEVVHNNSNNSCKNGYVVGNVCYSNKTIVGNLTFKEYNSGKYNIKNNLCEGLKTLQNSEGKYVLTYINCEYNEMISQNSNYSNTSYTIYTYQEFESREVTYYRYRTVTPVSDDSENIYTKNKYEENYLPEGFVKVPGSEETYYSYKFAECEK